MNYLKQLQVKCKTYFSNLKAAFVNLWKALKGIQ